jgi:hypothetical protein
MTAWQTIAVLENDAGAQILLGLLQSEGVTARIKADTPVPGLGISFRIQVPPEAVQQAQSILLNARVGDDELTTLAINTPPEDDTP